MGPLTEAERVWLNRRIRSVLDTIRVYRTQADTGRTETIRVRATLIVRRQTRKLDYLVEQLTGRARDN